MKPGDIVSDSKGLIGIITETNLPGIPNKVWIHNVDVPLLDKELILLSEQDNVEIGKVVRVKQGFWKPLPEGGYTIKGRVVSYYAKSYGIRFDTVVGTFYRIFPRENLEFPEGGLEDMQMDDTLDQKIVSDGGSSAYYEIHIPKSLVREDGDNYIFQVEHVIEYGLNNDFDKGNLFKVLYRLGRKAGNTLRYEIKKMYYSLKKLEGRFEREGKLDE